MTAVSTAAFAERFAQNDDDAAWRLKPQVINQGNGKLVCCNATWNRLYECLFTNGFKRLKNESGALFSFTPVVSHCVEPKMTASQSLLSDEHYYTAGLS